MGPCAQERSNGRSARTSSLRQLEQNRLTRGARAPWEWAQRASARRSQPLNLWLGSPPTKIEALAGRARRAVDSCQAPYRRDEATHAHPRTVREECGAHSSVVGRAVRERAVDGHSLPFSPGGSTNEQGGSCLFTVTPLPLPFPFLGEGLPLPLPFRFFVGRLLPYCVPTPSGDASWLFLVLDAGVSRVLKKNSGREPLPLPFPFLGEGLPLPLPFRFFVGRLLPYCVFHFPQVILALLLVLDAGVSRVLKKNNEKERIQSGQWWDRVMRCSDMFGKCSEIGSLQMSTKKLP